MSVDKPIIKVNDLTFSYDGVPVLEEVTFSVNAGDYVGIIGPNGGGKTTLLKILLGLLTPKMGTVIIDGFAAGTKESKLEIGYVPQKIAQDTASFPATVYEIVESGRVARTGILGRFSDLDKKAIIDSIKTAGVEHLTDRLINTLSGGERQRTYVARALANKPRILILDEPFVGVDAAKQKEFYLFLKKLNTEQGLTILFVSHDVDVVMAETKSLLCLNLGVLCYDKPEHVQKEQAFKNLYDKKVTHLHHV